MKNLEPMILSISHYKKAVPFILHFLMTLLVAFVALNVIGSPDTVYNLNHRRPRVMELDGRKTWDRLKSSRPLQSDITTALSIAASGTRAAAAWWAGKLLWRYAFMLMEKGEITVAGFSKVVNGGIMTLLWPREVANRKNVFLVYLIIFTCFGMDYVSSILTGSVTWQPSFVMLEGWIPLTDIPQGIPGADISRYRNSSFSVSVAIEGGAALELVSWENLNTNSSNLPIPSHITRRAIIQLADIQTIQNISLNSMLDSIRLPYFRVVNFEYITDPDATLTSHQKLLLNDSSDYNPYSNDWGLAAFLPDTFWGPGTDPNLPDPVTVSESRILAIRLFPASGPDCSSTFPESFIPSSVNFYPTITASSTNYSCFAFANVTYIAGGTICHNCMIVSPAVVEGNMSTLRPVPDPLTIEALAITPSVATHSLFTGFTDISSGALNGVESYVQRYVTEFVSRAYQSAWSYLAYDLGGLGPDSQTDVTFAIPASHPAILQWRVYFWAGLHVGVLFCGITFAYWQSHYRHPWFSNPRMAAFQLDTAGIYKEGRVADPKDPWDPTAEYPAGRLQLQNYDHERPGQPRAATLIQEDSDKLGDVLKK
ncbi:hypothetical protein K443DRAFT_685672 [Laccaria amethystina LaAM-08-1]|uniref:Transmembrane protein n=1 Tax=Laccaria amethystina LaAM-08-1 TaxID=1095629 RepID=A0A0C9X5Z1_9AGAR|nr:hypothetical protein K443DRAFT_685672 [Laccaria amethystina LaAM-08-1]